MKKHGLNYKKSLALIFTRLATPGTFGDSAVINGTSELKNTIDKTKIFISLSQEGLIENVELRFDEVENSL
ncbi:unnamed protein product [marine sediment metagenome]|uniref:Uncharacterized protein n=1 Tax=marine sediment metagenome TaxID=412755 RepID=X1VWS1_9ZZZZ